MIAQLRASCSTLENQLGDLMNDKELNNKELNEKIQNERYCSPFIFSMKLLDSEFFLKNTNKYNFTFI